MNEEARQKADQLYFQRLDRLDKLIACESEIRANTKEIKKIRDEITDDLQCRMFENEELEEERTASLSAHLSETARQAELDLIKKDFQETIQVWSRQFKELSYRQWKLKLKFLDDNY